MLVLLIIFMVAAPMMTVGIPVDLPKTEAAKMNDETEPLVVTLDKKGELYFQETVIPFEQLIERLEAITLHNPEAKVYVRGDKSLPYGKVIEIMGMIAASGLTKVSLITESSQQDPKNSKRKNR
jgi:biopolymer transport protein TolR